MSRTETDAELVVPEWKPERQFLTDSEVDDKGSYKHEGIIELRIDQFAEFIRDEEVRRSEPMYIRGLSWRIYACSEEADKSDDQDGQSPSKRFTFGLSCHDKSTNKRWDCEAKYSICIKAQNEGVKDFVSGDIKNIFKANVCIAFSGARVDLLLDPENGYIKDDTVILQAHVKPLTLKAVSGASAIKVYGQLFSSSTQYPWDFVLVIEDKEVHVQKSLLAIHSEYFKDQFAQHEHEKRAILQDVDYGELIELLSVIYPTLCPIKAENEETISKLAFKFKMTALLTQCESFLMENNREFGGTKALLLAERYGLQILSGTIIYEVEDIADIKSMKPEYNALSNRTKLLLFDRICSPAPASDPEPDDTVIVADRATRILQELASSVHCAPTGILIVENKRIPIHKELLATYSEYFTALFQGEFAEKNKDEIVLKEVGYNDILELLQVIYPTEQQLSITEVNIDVILKMSDLFIMPAILARCKKLLQTSMDIRTARKLWLAQRYNLPELQAEYANKYKTMSDVEELRAEPEVGLFDAKTRVLILDSLAS